MSYSNKDIRGGEITCNGQRYIIKRMVLNGNVIFPAAYSYTLTDLEVVQWSSGVSYFLASGSNYCIIRAKYNTFQGGNLISSEWVYPELTFGGDSDYIYQVGNDIYARNRGTNNNNTLTSAARTFYVSASYNGITASTTLTLQQQSNIPAYSESTTVTDSGFGISANRYNSQSSPCPAGGGTVSISKTSYGYRTTTTTTTYTYPSGSTYAPQTTSTTALSASDISIGITGGYYVLLSGNTVTFPNLTTTTTALSRCTIYPYTQYATGSGVSLYQAANTYSDTVTYSCSFSHGNFVQSGSMTAKACADNCTVTCDALKNTTRTWVSGSSQITSDVVIPTITASGTGLSYSGGTAYFSARNKETASRQGTLTAKYGSTTLGTLTLTQAAVVQTKSLSLSSSSGTIGAGGGSATLYATWQIAYDSGAASDTGTVSSGWSCINTGSIVATFSVTSGGYVSVSSLGRTVTSSNNSGVFSVTWNGITKTITLYQAANTKTTGNVTISGTANIADIPAYGGSVYSSSISGLSASQVINYASGETDSGSVTWSYNKTGVYSGSLGQNITSRSVIDTIRATATGDGGKSAYRDIPVYQQANIIEGYDFGSSEFTAIPQFTEFGGSEEFDYYFSGSIIYTAGVYAISGTPSISISGSGFSLSGNMIVVTQNLNTSDRYGTLTMTYNSQIVDTASVQQAGHIIHTISISPNSCEAGTISTYVQITSTASWTAVCSSPKLYVATGTIGSHTKVTSGGSGSYIIINNGATGADDIRFQINGTTMAVFSIEESA